MNYQVWACRVCGSRGMIIYTRTLDDRTIRRRRCAKGHFEVTVELLSEEWRRLRKNLLAVEQCRKAISAAAR